MYSEHLIYSAALAVIVGMIFSRTTGRDPSWIIIAVALVPDIDMVFERVHRLALTFFHTGIHHGDWHNILMLMMFSFFIAWVLHYFGIRFIDALICSAIGIAAHFFEDALVYKPAYAFLWPVTGKVFGLGIIKETRNLFGIGSSTVVLIGLLLLAMAVLVRTLVEGTGWWRVFLRGGKSSID